MPPFRYTRGEERGFLDTSFEADGDGFLFYRSHWSRGIPVSAAEREACLARPFDDERRRFEAMISGRAASGPRRPYWLSYSRMLAAFPAGFGAALLAFGAMFLGRAYFGDDAPVLIWLWLTAGWLSAGLGAQIVLVRPWRRRRRKKE
jgi:hypothetical protein